MLDLGDVFDLFCELCSFRTLLVLLVASGLVLLGPEVFGWSLRTTLIVAGLTFVVGMVWSRRSR